MTERAADLLPSAGPTTSPKSIGVLGGMSPESTADYYRRLNEGMRRALGGHHSARIWMYSVDFQNVYDWMHAEQYEELADHLSAAAGGLEAAGADFVVLACNTVHHVAPQIEQALSVPFIHIADVLAERMAHDGLKKVGLLASRFTVELPFYHRRLGEHGLETVMPGRADREEVNRVICEELCFHELKDSSRKRFVLAAERMVERGADCIALACTEVGLLVDVPEIAGVPVLDTTVLHTEKAVDLALGRAGGSSRAA